MSDKPPPDEQPESSDDDIPEDVIVKVTDYLDGKLTGAAKAEVEAKIASTDPADKVWKTTHDEMREARDMISGIRLKTAKAPDQFVEHVTETIHKRSAGRFFARRTLGERVPFGVLVIIALVALGIVGYLMWSSPTGSLKVEKPPTTNAPPPDRRLEIKP
jgi:anti-sigma factor RsiW